MISIRYDIITDSMTNKVVDYLKNNSSTLLITKEESKKSKKLHHHAHFEYNWSIKIESAMTKIRRKLKDIGFQNYYVKKVKDYEKHLIYILKDGNIVYTNIPEKTLNSFLNRTVAINKDKKLPVYKKLYNRWIDYDGKLDIYSFIYNTMVIDFDTFCRRGQILEYAAYIEVRQSNGTDTRNILNKQFGIFDYAHAHEEKLDAWYRNEEELLKNL
ncbi:MAG: putative replicase [Circoviridae sp.]|nr:MAG: putative replicase [Circoviridae sp.]